MKVNIPYMDPMGIVLLRGHATFRKGNYVFDDKEL